jgi:hypothetical protein
MAYLLISPGDSFRLAQHQPNRHSDQQRLAVPSRRLPFERQSRPFRHLFKIRFWSVEDLVVLWEAYEQRKAERAV